VACAFCIAQYLLLRPWDTVFAVAPEVLWLSALNGTLCTVVPVLLVMFAIERIGSGLASQAGMVGPMSTVALGVLVLDEPFNGWVMAGTALVLVGIYVCSKAPAVQPVEVGKSHKAANADETTAQSPTQ
jgi:drug/metabolite transporter (DMT)-like permease